MASNRATTFTLETIYAGALKQIEDLRLTSKITQAEFEIVKQTTTPQQFLESIKEQGNKEKGFPVSHSKITEAIRPLLLQLERFGSAIDMLAQSSPQIAGVNLVGLIWGSLKLLIVVARDISDTFEVVLAALEDVHNALPALSVYIDVFGGSKLQLLKEPLTAIYAKLILFGLQVVKLFNHSVIRTLGRSALKSLQLDVKSLVASTSKAKKDIESLAGAEHMHQTNEANRVQLLENQKAEEFRRLIGVYFAGNATSMLVHGSPVMAFNAAPIGLLSSHFCGRDAELSLLDIIFSSRLGHDIQCCVIRGMPGVGKTQLVLRYAKSTWKIRYTFVFWLSANTIEKLNQGFAGLLNLVGHVDRNHPEQPARLTAARRWLEDCQATTPKSWLLIVDNANKDTLGFLREHLPRTSHGGDILFTTRTESVGEALAQSSVNENNVIALATPLPNDAARLLLEHTGIDLSLASSADFARAIELVKSVGCLPLAVDQAASFIRQKKSTLENLLSLYRSEKKSLFIGWQNELSTYEQRSIAATFNLQLDELDRSYPRARGVLSILSFLDIEGIPIEMIEKAVSVRPSVTRNGQRRFSMQTFKEKIRRRHSGDTIDATLAIPATLELMGSPNQLRDALQELQDLSLIDQQQSGDTVKIHIHDLVQYMTQAHSGTKESCQRTFDATVALICDAFAKIPDPCSYECWAQCEVFIPHIQSLTKYSDKTGDRAPQLVAANIAIAGYFRARGRYAEAEALFQDVLARTEKQLGPTNPSTMQAKLDVASVYKRLGRYKEVESLLRQILGELKTTLGSNDLHTMRTAQTLATVCMELGKYEEAVKRSERTLARVTKVFGSEHVETSRAMQNLALIYEKRGDLDEAEDLYKQALAGRRELSRATDSELQSIRHNLAVVYSRQGRFDEAEPLYEQALEWRKRNLGPKHPETLSALQNLALVCYEKNENDRAKELGMKALFGRREHLGSHHLETLQSAQNLAMIHLQQNEFPEAEELYKTALAGFESQLGPQNPSTLRIVHNLAYCYERQKRFDEAQFLYQRALEGRENQLGSQHTDTLRTRGRLQKLRAGDGRIGPARE